MNNLSEELKIKILKNQKAELTEHYIYKTLAKVIRNPEHSNILLSLAEEELSHYKFFKELTEQESAPDKLKIFFYTFLSKLLGLNFGLKLMENSESLAQKTYDEIKKSAPEIDKVLKDENRHENELITLVQEERLKYVSSVVLGLNDALVEISGALVGFSLALQRPQIVGIVGLITGIAGSLSMGASSYLAAKEERLEKTPFKSGIYTGLAYIGTIIMLVMPYFFIRNIFFCLLLTIITVILLIFFFNFYISVAKDLKFKNRFFEMIGISLGVATINFFIGMVMRNFFGIEI